MLRQTIHKSQGQTLERVGVYLKTACFTHGQLYVAASRVGKAEHLRFAVDRDADELVERQVEARRFTGGRPRSRSKSAERSRGSSDGRRRRRDRSRSRERSSRSHRSSHDFEHRY